ncbi:Zb protein [Earliella scabrosa]|nr:Zb protein [Earliella scabrosa]
MVNVKTSWNDLSNLGWSKSRVYDAVNAVRDGTMEGQGDMALNERFADDYGWYCYNVLKGDLVANRPVINEIPESDSIAFQYDNTSNTKPFTDTWTETWKNTESATLSVKNAASIELKQSISIQGICNTEFGFTVSTESTETRTDGREYTLSHTFPIEVGPGEIFKLIREKHVTLGSQLFTQDYGLDRNNNLIATKGRKWKDHYYWGFYLNTELNNPSGTMSWIGETKNVIFNFRIERTRPDGTVIHDPVVIGAQAPGTLKLSADAVVVKGQAPVPGVSKEGANVSV